MKVLLVEPKTAAYLRKGLSEEGFIIDIAADGDEGLYTAKSFGFDLIVFDVMLPSRDGWEILSEIRSAGQQTPVLMWSKPAARAAYRCASGLHGPPHSHGKNRQAR